MTVPPWCDDLESSRLLYVLTPLVFAYYSSFLLRANRRELLYPVLVSEFCVLTGMSFITSALIDAPFGLVSSFPGAVHFVSEGVLIPLPSGEQEFVDAAGFFEVIRHCSFDPALVYLAYRRAGEVDWNGVNCADWFHYKGQTEEVKDIPARQVPGK